MKKILNKRSVKLTVGDLKEALKDIPDDREIALSFMLYDEGRMSVYLAEIYTHMKYDPVLKERMFDEDMIVELVGFTDDYSTYIERDDDS